MPLFQLNRDIVFPDPEFAEPDGLLAIGGDLTMPRLIAAYRCGIFPWYSAGDPILWWSPDPRLVLFPSRFHLPRRLARTIRKQLFKVTADTAFTEVITACGSLREESGGGTWITDAMKTAYIHLHEKGFAHSVECWFEGELAGGLYGVCLDRIFFGESMFTRTTDASKVALAALVRQAEKIGIQAIDCQMTTAHLLRFGSQELNRQEFKQLLHQCIQRIAPQKKWQLD